MRLLPSAALPNCWKACNTPQNCLLIWWKTSGAAWTPAVFCAALRSKLLHFNGKLFKTPMRWRWTAMKSPPLVRASRADWT